MFLCVVFVIGIVVSRIGCCRYSCNRLFCCNCCRNCNSRKSSCNSPVYYCSNKGNCFSCYGHMCCTAIVKSVISHCVVVQ